jgi:excisionase family DNA binding protein
VSDRLLVDLDEAAERLSLSRRSVQQLVFDGVRPSVKVRRRRLVAVSDLTSFVDALRQENAPHLTVVAPRRLRSG